jgi:hypothetical protein
MACRPCDRRLSRRPKNAVTSGLSQSAPVSAAAPRPINPETATIVSLLMTTPVPAGGMYNTLGRNTANSLRQRRRHSRVDCGPGIRRRRRVARDRAPASAGGRAAVACRVSLGGGATADELSPIHRRACWVVHKHVQSTGRCRSVLGAHHRTRVGPWRRRHARYISRRGWGASDRPGGGSRFGVGRSFPWRFRAAYPVRQTPRWCARRRAHSSRTSDLRRRTPDAFSAHDRAIILRALGPTIAVADGSAGVRESPHAGGSLFATGYGNKFQMSSR